MQFNNRYIQIMEAFKGPSDTHLINKFPEIEEIPFDKITVNDFEINLSEYNFEADWWEDEYDLEKIVNIFIDNINNDEEYETITKKKTTGSFVIKIITAFPVVRELIIHFGIYGGQIKKLHISFHATGSMGARPHASEETQYPLDGIIKGEDINKIIQEINLKFSILFWSTTSEYRKFQIKSKL